MQQVSIILKDVFKSAISKLFPDFNEWDKLSIQAIQQEQFGDYQTNFAMVTAKDFRQPPRKSAEAISEIIPIEGPIASISVAGPGFINITLADEWIAEYLTETKDNSWDFKHLDRDGFVVIDYSSPNIAKPMHVGHLRTTIIGESIKRIYKFLGYSVIADNHLGDWGTQFGKLIVGYHRWLDVDAFEKDPIAELERIYIKFGQEAESDVSLNDSAREELRKVQEGDVENKKLWELFISLTLSEIRRIYNRMEVSFDTWYGESFYNDMMKDVIDELSEKKIAIEDDGALVVFFPEESHLHPCIVRKKDGAYLYATSDLATIRFKFTEYKMNRALYVTDARQATHFKQVFTIAEQAGWKMQFEHIPFGIMSFQGKAFSTRGGNAIPLTELLDEAITRARAVVEEKNPSLSDTDKDEIAKVVGIGAVKYADLSQNRTSGVDFSWEKALAFEGNTAPYIQYSYARVQSILRSAGSEVESGAIAISEPQERRLATALLKFPEIVEKSAESYRPNLIADYLFDLVQRFGSFYNALSVLKVDEPLKSQRLRLITHFANTVKDGLELLGISVVDKM
ncbi:arginine--tRNA ligase [bacterium]|nr:arginine--tRNA ligase [bacterium]